MRRTLRYILMISFFLPVMNIYAQDTTSSDQRYSFEFRGDALSDVLDQITKVSGIDLVYDPQLVRDHHVYQRLQDKEIQTALKTVLKEFQLDYLTLSSGTYVIVRSVSEGPLFGTFSGKISDSETGEPLPGATVLLADASGGTSTNRSGNFSLNRLMTGRHTIIFSYVGYEPVMKTYEIGPNEEIREQITLEPKPQSFSPIVVESHRQRVPGQQSLSNPDHPLRQAGGVTNDAIRSLNFIPGIQYGLPITDLHLQGGQQGEHRILLDGAPIYNPYSFGHLFSAFSPYALGSIELHKAGYGVQQGSQIAGLIDFSHDLKNSETKGATLQSDPVSLNIRGDIGFEFGDAGLNLMTAFRTNFWDLYRDPNLEKTLQNWDILDPLITNFMVDLDTDASNFSPYFHDSDVRFYDYHFAASYKLDDFNIMKSSLYIAENRVETYLLNQNQSPQPDPPYIFATDHNVWKNLMARFSWNKVVTPRLDITTQASYSSSRFQNQNQTGITYHPITRFTSGTTPLFVSSESYSGRTFLPLPTQIDGNSIDHTILQSDATYSITPAFSLEGGIRTERIHTSVELAELTDYYILNDQSSTLFSSFINSSHTFGYFWNIDWGSRFTYNSQMNTVFPEPRVSVQYDRPDSGIGFWSARISGGLYRQFINEFRITNTSPTAVVPSFTVWSHAGDLDIPKAWHLNSSFLLEPDSKTSLKLEAYYKWQPVTNITSYVSLHEPQVQTTSELRDDKVSAFGETTEMTAVGGSLRLNRSLSDYPVELLAGYDYSRVLVEIDSQFGRTVPAPWNEPHRMHFRAMWHVLPELTLISKWQGIWGRTWAFRDSYYNYLPYRDSGIPLPQSFDRPEEDKLPSFYQVDLSVIYRPNLGPADMDIRLELINLLNRANTLDQYLLPVFSDGEQTGYSVESRTFPGFYPSMSLSITF